MKKDNTPQINKNKKAGTTGATQLARLMSDTLLGKVSPRDANRLAKVIAASHSGNTGRQERTEPLGQIKARCAMKLYHRTTAANAAAIIKAGFVNGKGTYMTTSLHTGVWLSDVPLDINEGAKGDTLLEVSLDIPESGLTDYEWIEEGKPYREWLVPARLINPKMQVRIISEEEQWQLDDPKFGGAV